MKWWKNLRITYKIALGFFFVSLLAGTVAGVTGVAGVEGIRKQNNESYENVITPVNLIANIDELYQQTRSGIRSAVLQRDEKAAKAEISALDETMSAVSDKYLALTAVIQDKDALGLLNDFKKKFDAYGTHIGRLDKIVLRQQSGDAQAELLGPGMADAEANVTASIGALQTKMLLLDIAANRQNQATAQAAVRQIALFSALAMLLALLLGILIARSVGKPLKKVLESANRLAEGDMGVHLDALFGRSEIGVLASAFGRMTGAIGAMTRDVDFLVGALAQGSLAARADATRHSGEFRRIIEGFNGAVEALVAPVDEATAVLERVSRYDLTRKVEGKYHGKMGVLANAVNDIMLRLEALQGIFTELSEGDASRLGDLEKTGKRSENDRMVPSIVKMMRTLLGLLDEANALSADAARGNLSVRGDAGQYEGLYSRLIMGINGIVDAVARPLGDANTALEAMAGNDFTACMQGEYEGAYASLSHSINRVSNTLSRTLGGIDATAEQVAAGTRQVSEGSQTLSQGAAEQASAIEQITASVAQIAVQANQTAENAGRASTLAASAREKASGGKARMKELQQAMAEIDEASSNISKIIQVIDGIAFQTNLLALNAAVEAARAGQHGKGFAVVAEEVRSLAKRSADAAKKTAELIEASIHKAKAGTHAANETAEELNRIVDGIEQATALVSGIAQASGEQAAAVAQVNRNIEQVSLVTQANTTAAEESAAASEELTNQAVQLKEMVGRFNLRKTSVTK